MAIDILPLSGFSERNDISLLIENSTRYPGKYYVILDGHSEKYLALTADKVPWVCNYLWQGAEEFLNASTEKDSTYAELLDLLEDPEVSMAYHGYAALDMIFGKSDLKTKLLSKIHEALEKTRAMGDVEIPVLEIQSNALMLPWDWLYLESHPPIRKPDESSADDDAVKQALLQNMKPFWGFSMIVSRLAYHENTDSGSYGQRYTSTNGSPLDFNLIIDEEIEFADLEHDAIKQLITSMNLSLNTFVISDDYKRKSDFAININEFMSQASDILHLICHAAHTEDGLSIPYIQLGKHRYRADFANMVPRLEPQASLVFFNACSLGLMCTGDPLNFIRAFWEEGLVEVVAADARIASEMASHFTRHFYKYLIEDGYNLGEAFFHARMEIIYSSVKPADFSILFYGLYGHAAHRLVGKQHN